MDENKEVNSTDPKREKVRVIPLSAIDDAPEHPFGVRDDDEMAELVESISTFGVINPVIVRKGEGERYELISGHRRKYIDTAVKMIISVVLGSLLLTGLYQLFNSVVLPGLADRIQSMF